MNRPWNQVAGTTNTYWLNIMLWIIYFVWKRYKTCVSQQGHFHNRNIINAKGITLFIIWIFNTTEILHHMYILQKQISLTAHNRAVKTSKKHNHLRHLTTNVQSVRKYSPSILKILIIKICYINFMCPCHI